MYEQGHIPSLFLQKQNCTRSAVSIRTLKLHEDIYTHNYESPPAIDRAHAAGDDGSFSRRHPLQPSQTLDKIVARPDTCLGRPLTYGVGGH